MVGGPQTEKGEGVVANSDSGKAPPAILDSDSDDQKSEGEKRIGKDDHALEDATESAEGKENESAAKLMAEKRPRIRRSGSRLSRQGQSTQRSRRPRSRGWMFKRARLQLQTWRP